MDKDINFDYMPTSPYIYKNKGWISIGDFLGTGRIATQKREYLSYEEAKKIVHKLRLKSVKEWYKYCKSGKKTDNISRNAYRTYKDEWVSWSDFLGTDTIATNNRIYLSFEDAKKFVSLLGLNSITWRDFCEFDKPDNIPASPDRVYKNKGWISWSDFLSTGKVPNQKRVFCSFGKARRFVRKLKLKSYKEWCIYRKSDKRPSNIPSNPNRTYSKKWISWTDFLGY